MRHVYISGGGHQSELNAGQTEVTKLNSGLQLRMWRKDWIQARGCECKKELNSGLSMQQNWKDWIRAARAELNTGLRLRVWSRIKSYAATGIEFGRVGLALSCAALTELNTGQSTIYNIRGIEFGHVKGATLLVKNWIRLKLTAS